MRTFKSLETGYAGCRFRSRLEARWAVFFDVIREPWEYEPEGFELSNGVWYLPDFWLPEMNLWIEVKGKVPTKAEEEKIRRLALDTGNATAIFHGHPTSNLGQLFCWTPQFLGHFACAVADYANEEMALSVLVDGLYMNRRGSIPLRMGIHRCYASWAADIARLARFNGESIQDLAALALDELGVQVHQLPARLNEP